MIIPYLNMIQVKLRIKIEIFMYHVFKDLYNQSSHIHQHLVHHHLQYPHENPSLSPQQSSTSDADETSTPPPTLNRGVVCYFFSSPAIQLITSYNI